MEEPVENIVVYRGKPSHPMTYAIRRKLGYQPIKTTTIASGKIEFKHIIGQMLFDSSMGKLYNIRKPVLLDYIRDNGGYIKKSSTLVEILDKIKKISYYNVRSSKIIHCIQSVQQKFKEWLYNPEVRLLGPGIPISRCVNDECPFTLENLKDLGDGNVITWRGDDSKIYGCDFIGLFTLLKTTLGGRTIYTDRYEELMNILNEIIKLQKDQRTPRPTRNNRRYMIFNEMKNPFNREKFQPELLSRLLQLANQRNMIKTRTTRNNTVRRWPRVRTDIDPPEMEEVRNLVGAGIRMPNQRHNILYSTDDATNWEEQIVIAERITHILRESEGDTFNLRNLLQTIDGFVATEHRLADEIRKLGFYVPDNMFSSVMNPIRECIRVLANDSETTSPIPIIDVHVASLIHSIRHYLIPVYGRIRLYFSNPVFTGGMSRVHISLSNIIHTTTILNGIRTIMRNEGIVHSLDETHRSRLISVSKHLVHMIVVSWVYCIRHLLLELFVRGQSIHISTGEYTISEGDRQTIAILLISALVNTGHLGSEFEWAM